MIYNRFLEESTSGKLPIITKYPDFVVYPEGYTWFHLICIYFADPSLVVACVEQNLLFTLDTNNKSPLHYLVESGSKNPALINYLLANFKKIFKYPGDRFDYLAHFGNIFVSLFKVGVPGLCVFLSFFMMKPRVFGNEELSLFSTVRTKPKAITVDGTPFLRNEIYRRLTKKTYGNANIISIECPPCRIDLYPLSDDIEDILFSLKRNEHPDTLKSKFVQGLVLHAWNNATIYHRINALIISAYMVLLSIWALEQPENYGEARALVIIIGIYTVAEFVKIIAMGFREYFSDVWNISSIVMALIQVGGLAYFLAVGKENGNLGQTYFISIMILFGYFKWFAVFRSFKATRKKLSL